MDLQKIPGLSLAKTIVFLLLITFALWMFWGYTGLSENYKNIVKMIAKIALWGMFIWGFFMMDKDNLISFSSDRGDDPSHWW